LRSIVGSLTVEQIIRDRAAFAQRVADEAETSLTGQGLALDTFQIQDITDDGSYLSDLGRPEAARIGQAASISEAEARRAAEQARIKAEEEIAIAQRALALKQSEIKAETDAASAQAAAAGPLAQADRDQAILLEQEKVAVRQAALKDRQLDTEVRKPADGERYRVETEAEGKRNAEVFEADARRQAAIAAAQADAEKARLTGEGEKSRRSALAEAEVLEADARRLAAIAAAQADAEKARLTGEGDKSRRSAQADADAIEGAKRGEAEKARRVAEADAVRAEGDAHASSILAIGNAEAEAMEKRAAAFADYNDAAVLQMLIEVLPKMAREVAAPMASIDKLTVISTDGAGALPKQVTDNVVQTMELLKTTTGVDLQALIERFTGSESDRARVASPRPIAAPVVPSETVRSADQHAADGTKP